MKLATRKNARRDGELLVVNRTLTEAVSVPDIAETLQGALDDWAKTAPKLKKVYQDLNAGQIKNTSPFDPNELCAPLPRAYQWADASAYLNHVELVRKARGAEMPENFLTDPLMYQGGSDVLLGPSEDILAETEDYGIDFEGEVAVITTDVPMGISAADAVNHIALVMLVNDVSLRRLVPNELAKGFGFFQSKPSSAFSPVAVSVDELAPYWKDGKLHLPLQIIYNGALFGHPNAGVGMQFDFGALISHAAKTRALCAGSIVGSGTVSNKDRSVGHACIVEKRMLETLEEGKAKTPFMKFGDEIKIEMLDNHQQSIFGAIHQKVRRYVQE